MRPELLEQPGQDSDLALRPACERAEFRREGRVEAYFPFHGAFVPGTPHAVQRICLQRHSR